MCAAEDYAMEVAEDPGTVALVQQIQQSVEMIEARAVAFREQYGHLSHLWTTPLQASLQACCSSRRHEFQPGCVLTAVLPWRRQEFLDAEGGVREDGTKDAPNLASFEAQIARYRGLQEEVQALPSQVSLGFMRADARPLRGAIAAWTSKWTFLYTRCLQDRVSAVDSSLCAASAC
jgi:dynein heavy chain